MYLSILLFLIIVLYAGDFSILHCCFQLIHIGSQLICKNKMRYSSFLSVFSDLNPTTQWFYKYAKDQAFEMS